jgi:hypothetical protein
MNAAEWWVLDVRLSEEPDLQREVAMPQPPPSTVRPAKPAGDAPHYPTVGDVARVTPPWRPADAPCSGPKPAARAVCVEEEDCGKAPPAPALAPTKLRAASPCGIGEGGGGGRQ